MDGDDGSGKYSHRTHWRDGCNWVQRRDWIHRTHGLDWNDGCGKYCDRSDRMDGSDWSCQYSDGTHWRDRCDWV